MEKGVTVGLQTNSNAILQHRLSTDENSALRLSIAFMTASPSSYRGSLINRHHHHHRVSCPVLDVAVPTSCMLQA